MEDSYRHAGLTTLFALENYWGVAVNAIILSM